MDAHPDHSLPVPIRSAWRHAALLAGIAALTVAAYANSLSGGFVLDSRVLILENRVLREATWESACFLATHDYWQPFATGGLYRPLVSLSYLFNFAVLGNGANPAGYHVVNLALHLACVACVYAVLWHLTGRRWPTATGAALFALHPIATEAVANIVGRADLLAALGVLGGLLCHIRATTSRGGHRAGWLAGLALAAAVAVFSKENGLVLPAVLVLALGWRTAQRNRDWRDDLSLWASAVRAAPESAKARKGLAQALFEVDPGGANLDLVIAEAEQATMIREDYTVALVDLGGYYVAKRDRLDSGADAADWYERAAAVLERASNHEAEADRRFSEALAARGLAVEGAPLRRSVALRDNLGIAYARLARFEDALDAYERGRRLQPEEARRYVDIAAVLASLGRLDDAAAALWQAVIVEPGHAEAGVRLATLYGILDAETAVVEESPGRVRIDLGHPLVREHRCAAYRRLSDLQRDAGRPDLARDAAAGAAEACARISG